MSEKSLDMLVSLYQGARQTMIDLYRSVGKPPIYTTWNECLDAQEAMMSAAVELADAISQAHGQLVTPPDRDESASMTARTVDELLQEDEDPAAWLTPPPGSLADDPDELMSEYAAKQAQDHAALLLHEQTRTPTPDDLLMGDDEEEGDEDETPVPW